MHNPLPSSTDNVVRSSTRMMPMPGIQQKANIRPTLLRKGEQVIHAPDEFVTERLPKMQRSEKFEPQAYVRFGKRSSTLGKPALVEVAQLVFRSVARRQDI